MIIGIPTPNNYLMPFESVKCFLNLPYKIVWASGPYIYENRNLLLQKAKYEQDSLLMIDSDMVFTSDDVERIQGEYITSGLYVIGTEPHLPCVFGKVEGDYNVIAPPKDKGIVGAVGGGFLFIPKDIVMKLPDNAFNDVWEGKVKHGEDISFCHKAKELGFDIYLDPSIKLGHLRFKELYPQME